MTREEKIEKTAIAMANYLRHWNPEESGLLKILKQGTGGLNKLPEDTLEKQYQQWCSKTEQKEELVVEGEFKPEERPHFTTKDFALTPKDFMNCTPELDTMGAPGYGIVALNVMVILFRTGNTFRQLAWEEYVSERNKDRNFKGAEMQYFEKVVGYCDTATSALTFCPAWAALKDKQP